MKCLHKYNVFLLLAFLLIAFSCTRHMDTAHAGYIVYVTTDRMSNGYSEELFDITKRWESMGGGGGEGENYRMYLLVADKTDTQDVKQQLQKITGFRHVVFVPFSKPMKQNESLEVRKILGRNHYDLSRVTNDNLSMYLNTTLKGDRTWCLCDDGVAVDQNDHFVDYLQVKRVKDVISKLKPDTVGSKVISDRKMKNGEEVHIEDVVISEPETMHIPPFKKPDNFAQMTDAQIKKWYIYSDTALKPENLEVRRHPDKITIIEWKNGRPGLISYPLKLK